MVFIIVYVCVCVLCSVCFVCVCVCGVCVCVFLEGRRGCVSCVVCELRARCVCGRVHGVFGVFGTCGVCVMRNSAWCGVSAVCAWCVGDDTHLQRTISHFHHIDKKCSFPRDFLNCCHGRLVFRVFVIHTTRKSEGLFRQENFVLQICSCWHQCWPMFMENWAPLPRVFHNTQTSWDR